MDMTARQKLAGRIGKKGAVAGGALAFLLTSVLMAAIAPAKQALADGGDDVIAELLKRSPGMRVGGIALKAKKLRGKGPLAGKGDPELAAAEPENPLASVLGSTAGEPETETPLGPEGFPTDFTNPIGEAPVETPAVGGLPGFIPGTGIGGGPIVIGGGGGGGGGTPGGGNPGGGNPGGGNPGGGNPGGGDPPMAAVPEPATWAMLIVGFGVIGAGMRRRPRPLTA